MKKSFHFDVFGTRIRKFLRFFNHQTFILSLIFFSLTFSFQNCSQNAFSFKDTEGMLDLMSLSKESILVTTELNVPKQFKLPYETTAQKLTLQILLNPSNGKLEVIDSQKLELRYTPQFGFRGQDQAEVTLKDFYGNIKTFLIKIVVGNPFSNIEPALAIRGMGCIQCHSNVSSDIITDFGYGDDFYFSNNLGGNWWKSGGHYGDHAQNWHTMNLGTSTKVIVPSARLPIEVANLTGSQWLDDYLKKQLARSANPLTASTPVMTKSKVRIGAPTSTELRQAFLLNTHERVKYFFDSSSGSSNKILKGLTDKGTYFSMRGNVDCDGDLFLSGPVLMEDIILNTSKGCRIYVDGSIFLYGSIKYQNPHDSNNLQLTSSRSINLGLGSLKKNGAYCDITSHYYKYRETSTYIKGSSLHTRYQDIWTTSSQVARAYNNSSEVAKTIIAESQIIESGEGKLLYDSECRAEGRNITFDSLLLNAPFVHSRYKGNFKGTIIAETGLMSLGSFVFSFDPVFQKVPVLPFLNMDQILKVE